MNQLIRKLTTQASNNKHIFTSFTILLAALIIGFSITIPTGMYHSLFNSYRQVVPKRVWFNKVNSITNYTNEAEVIINQPRISFKSSPKYFIVEVSDLDCTDCAVFHGYASPQTTSSYQKMLQDFVVTGKAAYTWIDSPLSENNKKHSSLYCAGIQSPKGFFTYRDKAFSSLSAFSIETAKENAKVSGVDTKEFEDCTNADTYKDRVTSLAQFSRTVIENTQTPTLYVYSITEESVKKIDGSQGKQKIAKKIATITNMSNYEFGIKPELAKVLSK
jgi:protein-disulfide isomerase